MIESGAPVNTIYIKSDGRVGIGTTSPGTKLEVAGNIRIPNGNAITSLSGGGTEYNLLQMSANAINVGRWEGSYGTDLYLKGGNGSVYVDVSQGNNGFFAVRKVSGTTPTELMRLTTAGDLGIGVTTPGAKLDVSGNIKASGDLDIGGQDIMLNGIKRISDSTSTGYTHIQPQSNYLIIYNGGANAQSLGIYGASGSHGVRLAGSTTSSQISGFGSGNNLTVSGGDVASAKLTLDSTTNATKGNVIIAPSGGNVGIGTTSPQAKLQIVSTDSDNTVLSFYDATRNQGLGILVNKALTGSWPPVVENTTMTLQSSGGSSGNLAFATGNTERIRIVSNTGNVGIGTTVPAAKLAVNGGLHVGGDSDPGDNNALVDGTLTVSGNANICNLVSYTGGGGSTQCPAGFYTWSGVALTSGYMLCCKVSNPI